MTRLEEAKTPEDVPAQITIPDILRAVERHLGAKEGEMMASTIVRDAETDTSLNAASVADGRDYVGLPPVLGRILWQVMEKARKDAGTETYMAIWHAGSDEVSGASPGEDHALVKQIRTMLAHSRAAAPDAEGKAPAPGDARVYVGDKRII